MVLNMEPWDWESSDLTTRPSLHQRGNSHKPRPKQGELLLGKGGNMNTMNTIFSKSIDYQTTKNLLQSLLDNKGQK